MQFFSNNLLFLTGLEDMKMRRVELQAQIDAEEDEKNNLQREIETLSYKLTRLNDSLTKRIAVRNEYDRAIADTETAYVKVIIQLSGNESEKIYKSWKRQGVFFKRIEFLMQN